eukprot:EG_transcript_58339
MCLSEEVTFFSLVFSPFAGDHLVVHLDDGERGKTPKRGISFCSVGRYTCITNGFDVEMSVWGEILCGKLWPWNCGVVPGGQPELPIGEIFPTFQFQICENTSL